MQIVVLAAQSNAAGHGSTAELTSPDSAMDQTYKLWQWQGHPFFTTDTAWHYGGPQGANFGPDLFMGKTLAAAGKRIGIVKVTDGGTSLGGHWIPSLHDLYDTLIATVHSALAALTEPYVISAFVWVGSDGDANTQALTDAWPQNFSDLITAFRAEFGVPNLNVYYSNLYSGILRNFTPQLRAYEQAFPVTHPHTTCIDTETLNTPHTTLIDDAPLGSADGDVHYDTASQRGLGTLIANTILPNL